MQTISTKARIIAFIMTIMFAVPLTMLGWWAFRNVFFAMGRRITDDNALLVIGVVLLVALFIGSFLFIVLAEIVGPFSENIAEWFIRRRERRRAERIYRAKLAEDQRLAEELHAAQATRAYLTKVMDDARVAAHADRQVSRDSARTEITALPDAGRSLGIFTRYASASAYHRMLIREGYHALMELAHPRHEYHIALAIADLPPLARLLFLPVAIDATDGPTSYDRLDFDATDHLERRYVYRSNRQVPDIDHWMDHHAAIEAYLGGRWRIERGVGSSIVLTGLPDIPEVFPLDPAQLLPGQLMLGRDLNTGAVLHVPLDQLSHTLVAGPTGMGKSVLLHQLMASVVTNLDWFEAIYLVDLKYGLELQDYSGLGPKFHLASSTADVAPLVATLLAEMDRRGQLMRASRKRDWDGPLVLVVIDEFADVLLGEPDKKKREALETSLVRLTNLSRALGFRFWVQSQKTTIDALPASIRNNLQSVISFRMVTNQAAAMLFGGSDSLPADITTLKRGQAIYRDGRTSDTVALQGALVTFADVERLTPPPPTG